MAKGKPTAGVKDKSFLVAEPSGFPGLRIPLLSDAECEARGIPKAEFPPFDSWSPEQQKAGRALANALMDMALPQALQLMLEEIEGLPRDAAIIESEIEPMAATRGIERIDSGKWKPGPRETHGLGPYVRLVLELFANRHVSLLIAPKELDRARKPPSRSRRSRQKGTPKAKT